MKQREMIRIKHLAILQSPNLITELLGGYGTEPGPGTKVDFLQKRNSFSQVAEAF